MARANNDLVQQRIALEHTRWSGLDEKGDMALRIGAAERPQHRRAEEHIADLTKLNDQNALCSKARCQISQAVFHAVPRLSGLSAGTMTIDLRVEVGVVIHFELAVELEYFPTRPEIETEAAQTSIDVVALF